MKTLLIDGNNSAWRCAMRLPVLTAHGKPIQVVYGVLRLVQSSIAQFNPDAVLMCWDSGRSEHRMKLYPEYKANREHDKKEYESVIGQMGTLKKVLELLNVANISLPKTEADDIIGVATRTLSGRKVVISTDQDMLQLVERGVSVWSPVKGKLYNTANFEMLTGLTPERWLEMRVLVGDKSDNISGVVKGFGETSAKELVHKFSVHSLWTNSVAKKVKKLGNRHKLLYKDVEKTRKRIFRNLLLMDLSLCYYRPEGLDIARAIDKAVASRHKIDKMAVIGYFQHKRFQSLLDMFHTWLRPFEELQT